MRKSKSGFTIIELLVVVTIIVVLAAITIVVYRGSQARARDAQRKTDIVNITKALELYYADNGSYPDPVATSSAINSAWYSSGDASWTGFALQMQNAITQLPSDPINSPGNPLAAGNYGYAYFTGGYCGKTSGQWYLLTYVLEGSPKERTAIGDCCTNPIGDNYYNGSGNTSYYRMVRN